PFGARAGARPHPTRNRVPAFNVNRPRFAPSAAVPAIVAPVDVESPFPAGFSNANGLQVNGSALFSTDEHLIRLNNNFGQAGSAFTTDRINASKFSTTFWVRLHEGTQPNPADGYAFVLQPSSPTALCNAGGALGYQCSRNS